LNAGNLDPSFGAMGVASIPPQPEIHEAFGKDVVIQPDGKVVLAVFFETSTFATDFGLDRFNTDGTLDSSFGTGGQVRTGFVGFSPSFNNVSVLEQPDGKLVVVGSVTMSTPPFEHLALARYNPDGSLDSSFGTGGEVDNPSLNANLLDTQAVLQADGKIVVLLATTQGTSNLVRYNSDGSLDSGFGSGGVVAAPFSNRLALQTDGRFILAYNGAVSRYNADGTPDSTFGNAGTILTNLPPLARNVDVALQPDGKIVFVGDTLNEEQVLIRYNLNGNVDATFGQGGFTVTAAHNPTAVAIDSHGWILVAGGLEGGPSSYVNRYQPNGTLDATFNSTAISLLLRSPTTLAFQSDGKIVVAATAPNGFGLAAVARLLTDTPLATANQRFVAQAYLDLLQRVADPSGFAHWVGLLDQQQATAEQVALGIEQSSEYRRLETQQAFGLLLNRAASADELNAYSGFLAAGGTVEQMQSTIAGSAEYFGRLTGGFPLDPHFGTGGIVSTQFIQGGTSLGTSVLTQPDGKIVLGGTTEFGSHDFMAEMAVARFNADGTPDTAFGTNGLVLTGLISMNGLLPAEVLLQADQKIVEVGGVGGSGGSATDIGLARINPDGTPDTSFGTGGTVETSFGNFSVTHTDAVLQPDPRFVGPRAVDRIIVAATLDFGAHADLLRYNSDGSLDNSFGTNGVLPVPFGGELVIRPDGKFILASNPGLTQYNADGSVDTTFGQGGTASTTLPPSTGEVAVARQSDGKIVYAGTTQSGQLAVFRFTATGGLDTTFGSGGLALFTNLPAPTSMAVDAHGRILISGGMFGQPDYLIRLEANGARDSSFLPAGNRTTPIDSPNDVFIDANDNILVAGAINSAGAQMAGIARLFSDPTASQRLPAFLNQLYHDALGRDVDPTAQNAYQQAFDSGALTTGQIAAQVFGSEEYFADLAQSFYRRFLHRDIDATGLTDTVSALQHGVTDEMIIAGIVGSPEYAAVRT
jgi:uncharacterized delta-60 repeat protein